MGINGQEQVQHEEKLYSRAHLNHFCIITRYIGNEIKPCLVVCIGLYFTRHYIFYKAEKIMKYTNVRERGGLVVEPRTPNREVPGSIPTRVTVWCL